MGTSIAAQATSKDNMMRIMQRIQSVDAEDYTTWKTSNRQIPSFLFVLLVKGRRAFVSSNKCDRQPRSMMWE